VCLAMEGPGWGWGQYGGRVCLEMEGPGWGWGQYGHSLQSRSARKQNITVFIQVVSFYHTWKHVTSFSKRIVLTVSVCTLHLYFGKLRNGTKLKLSNCTFFFIYLDHIYISTFLLSLKNDGLGTLPFATFLLPML